MSLLSCISIRHINKELSIIPDHQLCSGIKIVKYRGISSHRVLCVEKYLNSSYNTAHAGFMSNQLMLETSDVGKPTYEKPIYDMSVQLTLETSAFSKCPRWLKTDI